MILRMNLGERSYDITIERGCIAKASALLNLDRKCLIVTDEGVPAEYSETIAAQCAESLIITVPQGEESKSLDYLEILLKAMLEEGFTRGDCCCAVGGGMPGDLAGFAAATYMRGIDFYNIPTTVLSQADSSVGGKTAVNLAGTKNVVGAFHQPKAVLIDPETLETLPEQQTASGLAEIVKAGLIGDAKLFEAFEKQAQDPCKAGREILKMAATDKSAESDARLQDPDSPAHTAKAFANDAASTHAAKALSMDEAIEAAVRVKKAIVEADERETDLRRILNFGHTIGHGIESVTGMLHGECVALGMIPMCSPQVRERLLPVLRSLSLPVHVSCSADAVLEAMLHDKKMKNGQIGTVFVKEPGSAGIRMMTAEELRHRMEIIIN